MAVKTPLLQIRSACHRNWGNFSNGGQTTPANGTLPNQPAAPLAEPEFSKLEAGDLAYVTTIDAGVYYCESPGTVTGGVGNGDAVWRPVAGGGVASSGIYGADFVIYVAPNHPDAADDGNVNTPFVTIQAAIDATAVAAQWGQSPSTAFIRPTIYVAGGIYDEDLLIASIAQPNGGGDVFLELIALGPVTLGNAGAALFGSTNARNVVWVNNQADEDTGSGAVGGNDRRPTLILGTVQGWMGEGTSTHTQYACGWDISGDLRMVVPSGVADPFTTVDLHLANVKVNGVVSDDPGGDPNFDPKAGTTNCYFYKCEFEGQLDFATNSEGRIQVAEACRFDEVLANRYNRVVQSRINGSWSVSAFSEDLPPGGFISSTFTGVHTFTGPPGSLVLDAYSNERFKTAGWALGGGATKSIRGDLTP